MSEFLDGLGRALEGSPAIALGAAFLWGVLSIVLSPCHLASIPLVVGYVSREGPDVRARRAALVASAFALGMIATIALVGVATAAAGRMMGDLGRGTTYAVAAVLILVGLHLLGALPLPELGGGGARAGGRAGLLGALTLGLVFGLALGPCTFAYMAPMLAIAFDVSATRALFGFLLVATFAVGHGAVIVVAGSATGGVQRYLAWADRTGGAKLLRALSGALVIAGGLYLLYTAP